MEQTHRLHPDLPIIARTHSELERTYLREHRVDAILAEQELALTMNRHAMALLGCAVPATDDDVRPQSVVPGQASGAGRRARSGRCWSAGGQEACAQGTKAKPGRRAET